MRDFLIILRQFLANFRGRRAHYRILAGVVIGWTSKHVNTQRPFFECGRVACQGMLSYIPQQNLTSPAGPELLAIEDTLQLCPDLLSLFRREAGSYSQDIGLVGQLTGSPSKQSTTETTVLYPPKLPCSNRFVNNS